MMKRTTWFALAGCVAGGFLVSCGKKTEPTEVPTAPVAQVTPEVSVKPEPAADVTDLTPPPAEPPAPDATPEDEDPSVPDNAAAPD